MSLFTPLPVNYNIEPEWVYISVEFGPACTHLNNDTLYIQQRPVQTHTKYQQFNHNIIQTGRCIFASFVVIKFD